jgi:hypothetical protein
MVQWINSGDMDRSACGSIVHDIKRLANNFSSVSFRHVGREQNVAAHRLARSCEFYSLSVWRGVPPDCIRETICIDTVVSG